MAEPLLNGALGKTSMGPRPFLGPNHNPEKRASSMKSTDPVLGQDLQDKFCRISKIFTGVSKGGVAGPLLSNQKGLKLVV